MDTLLISILLIQYCFLFTTSIKISPCATWNKVGTTVAGTGTSGSSSQQLNWPHGIFIHQRKNALYVADSENNRVQSIDLNELSTVGTTVAGNVSDPSGIYVDDDQNGPVVYVALSGSDRVEKWTTGASAGIQVGGACRICAGVWLDNQKNIYMAEETRFRVAKWSAGVTEPTIVAGQTDKYGNADDLLNIIGGLYVHSTDGTVYVADRFNNRIQRWSKDATKGITVAGQRNGTEGGEASSINNPFGVVVDDETAVIYVVDTFNSRIQRWLPNASQGDTIAGGFGEGNGANQLNSPTSVTFDSDGNLYVSDSLNHRIQKFTILDNSSCFPASAGNVLVSKATAIMITSLTIIWLLVELI